MDKTANWSDENVRCESWPGDGVDDDDAENRELYKCNKSDWQCQTRDLAKPANWLARIRESLPGTEMKIMMMIMIIMMKIMIIMMMMKNLFLEDGVEDLTDMSFIEDFQRTDFYLKTFGA